MASTYTTNLGLAKPALDDEGWGDVCNANTDLLDASSPLSALAARTNESPSTTLAVKVAPGPYPLPDGSAGWFAGAVQALPASSTRVLFLDAVGALQAAAAYPTDRHVRIASVTTGATSVVAVVDARVTATPLGEGAGGSSSSALAVATAETPSASLVVTIQAGKYLKPDGSAGSFAGATRTIPASSTRVLYLDDSGALQDAAAYPVAGHVRLATVATSAGVVTSVVDDRLVVVAVGSASSALLLTGGTMADGATIGAGTTAGLKIATTSSQKLAFWGATPIARPGTYSAGYATSTRSLSGYTPAVQSSSYSGLASGQAGSPYAATSDLNALRTAYENLRLFVENLAQRQNGVVNDLKTIGLLS